MSLRVTFGAATLALLGGCGTMSQPVNQTERVAAVSETRVKISRCEDNGFHVLPANSYNMNQVGGNRGGGVSSALLHTANGAFIVQYPHTIGSNNSGLSDLAGIVLGVALGGKSTIGRVAGGVIGGAVISPVLERAGDLIRTPMQRERATKAVECFSDIYAMNGGAVVGNNSFDNRTQPRSRHGIDLLGRQIP